MEALNFGVRVLPQREFLAERMLKLDGFQVWLPVQLTWRRLLPHDRFDWQPAPLISGLIFVALEDEPWSALDDLRTWPFVLEILGNHADCEDARGAPKPIPSSVIDRIRAIEMAKNKIPQGTPTWQPERGQRVRVINGDHPMFERELIVDVINAKKAKRFGGMLEGANMLVWLKVKDVELV